MASAFKSSGFLSARWWLSLGAVSQILVAVFRAIVAACIAYLHDKIYLLLLVGTPLYVTCGIIGLHTANVRCKLWDPRNSFVSYACCIALLVNSVLICSDALMIAFMMSWLTVYESNVSMCVTGKIFLSVSIVIQTFIFFIILKSIARMDGEDSLFAFFKKTVKERAYSHQFSKLSNRGSMTLLPLTKHRVEFSDKPLTPVPLRLTPNLETHTVLCEIPRTNSAPSLCDGMCADTGLKILLQTS